MPADTGAAGGAAYDASAVTVDNADIGELAALVGDDIEARRAVTSVVYMTDALASAQRAVEAGRAKIARAEQDLAGARQAVEEAEAELRQVQADYDAAVASSQSHIERLQAASAPPAPTPAPAPEPAPAPAPADGTGTTSTPEG